jgi:thiamine biosynthesis lipoprotein
MHSVRLACEAMATRFEFVLHGRDPVSLRAAGEEAIEEIHRIEGLLSLYRPDSAIAAVNRDAARQPVRVPPEVFRLLGHAALLSQATAGAFDITVGPLLRAWGLMRGAGRLPSADELEAARACVGHSLVLLDESRFSVRFARPGVLVDLGSIGKGYALDRAAGLLRDAGIENALLHGGTSTALAWGRPHPSAPVAAHERASSPATREEDHDTWRIAIPRPGSDAAGSTESAESTEPLAVVELHDESLSVSAVWGKGFESEGRYFGHVMDPRAGRPVQGALMSAVVLPSATESDALSTALLVRGPEMLECLREARAPARCLIVERADVPPGWRVLAHRLDLHPSVLPTPGDL